MIRRRVHENFWLITQNNHAILSGQLAQHLGNANFTRLTEPAILGISMHDSGWPLHDDAPTSNDKGKPIDVFESRPEISLKVWPASANRASRADIYAGLLVSLHSLSLSHFATRGQGDGGAQWNNPRAKFELNQLQQNLIEQQETLRKQLGLRVDHPLKLGLAEHSDDPRERQLVFDFRWLQALDRVSLAICCTQPPFDSAPIFSQPDSAQTSLNISRSADDRIHVSPWPFDQDEIEIAIPYRAVPVSREFTASDFLNAQAQTFTVTLRELTI